MTQTDILILETINEMTKTGNLEIVAEIYYLATTESLITFYFNDTFTEMTVTIARRRALDISNEVTFKIVGSVKCYNFIHFMKRELI